MDLGISISKHTLSFVRLLCEPAVLRSCIFHLTPPTSPSQPTANLANHTSWCWMWSTFRCVKACIICGVLPWTGHACGCAGPATLRCLGWAPSEGGLSPAHKSCQEQIRRECLVMIRTQTQTRFALCPGLAGTLIQYQRKSSRACACLPPPTLPLPSWAAQSRGCSPQAWQPVSAHSSLTRYWYLDLGCGLD